MLTSERRRLYTTFVAANYQLPKSIRKLENFQFLYRNCLLLNLKLWKKEIWRSYLDLFEESGYEVYETKGWVAVVEERPAVQESTKMRSILGLREIEEQLRRQLYTVGEIMEDDGTVPEEQQGAVTDWMDHVRASVQPLTQIAPEEIARRRRPWEL